MLKRVPVARLRAGMFLHSLGGSWLDHPFWRNAFLLEAKDVRRIRASGVTEVVIDTARGLDVAEAFADLTLASDPEEALAAAVTSPLPLVDLPDTRPDHYIASGGLRAPPPQAMQVREHAKQAVGELFSQARMGVALDTRMCLPVVEQVVRQLGDHPGAMLNVLRIKKRDEYTYLHSVAVCALMVSLARTLGFDEAQCQEAGLAGLLHDIGKAVVPLDILVKPGRLTDQEYEVIRGHAAAGHALLRGARMSSPLALDVCLNHHEKVDGTGYPRRLAEREISMIAKMGAVCDVYDAVTSNRPYKGGWDPAEALREMVQWKGHFDPMVFQAFVKTVGIYPVGSLVRLRSRRLALVVAQQPPELLKPLVLPVYCLVRRERLPAGDPLDLRAPGCDDEVEGVERPAEWAMRGVEFDTALAVWRLED